MSESTTTVSRREIAKQLASLSWPLIGLNVLNVLALAVDTAMCGRLPGAETVLVGLGFATQLVFLLMVAMIGLTVGTVASIARAHGAGDRDRVTHTLAQSSQLTVILGLLVGVIGQLVAGPFVTLMGGSDEVRAVAENYLHPLLAGTALPYLSILYAAALRGVGNTRLAFFVALVINGLNALFNYGLILGNFGLPALGLRGAAYGTVLAYLCGVTLMITLLVRDHVPQLTLKLKWVQLDKSMAKQLIAVGWPAAFDMVVLNAAFLAIVGMLGRIDELAVAAHGIGLRVQALAFVPGMSVSQATGALVGQALGAGSVERARKVLAASIVLCVAIMTTLGAVIVAAGPMIVAVFDVDPASTLGLLSLDWMNVLGYGMPMVGLYIAYVGLLQGAGATRVSLRINLMTTFGFQIPASYILGFPLGLGAWGVWAGFPLAFVFKGMLAHRAYKRGTWAVLGTRP
ncbi:MAG: MATE family efflux transporter [Myxococcales bacterium]|nr:MATE family efflux transporter [Myxococcales bacterium]